MIARFLGAVQFLTTFPIRGATAPPGRSAVFFPLVGAGLGAAGASLLLLLSGLVPAPLASLGVLLFWAVATGALHEDGLADVADAFRAGRPRHRILAILKDSRIGTYGAVALILVTFARWQALAAISVDPFHALPGVLAISRSSIVALAWLTPPVSGGLGFEFARQLTSWSAVIVILQASVCAWFTAAGPLLLWGATIIVIGSRSYFVRRIGGVNGDCLGATGLLVETWGLLLLTCQRCI